MKALTIKEPFATLIMQGIKRVENRGWFTGRTGDLIIHAGGSDQYLKPGIWEGLNLGPMPRPINPTKVLGIVKVVDCVQVTGEQGQQMTVAPEYEWLESHPYAFGPFCWILDDVRVLEKPFKWKGQQKLWDATELMESDAWKNNKLIPVTTPG